MKGRIYVEYDGKEYPIQFEVVVYIAANTYGRYIPEEKKILLIVGCSFSTIFHEAIHATIDMFRSTKENFSELFDNRSVFGEEAFCHYACEIAEQIKEEIR